MLPVSGFDETLFIFIDGGVTTAELFCVIRVGVKTDGEVETEVRGLFSFLFFFVGRGANVEEAHGFSP